MTTTLVTLTGDVTDAIGTDFDTRRTKAYVRHNTDKIVTDDGPIHLGGGTVNVNADGTFELPNVVASTSLVENLQATVYVDYADPATRQREAATFGPYDLSAETGTVDIRDLEAVQALDPSFASETMAAMQALLDQQEAISGLTGEDDAVALLIDTPGSETAAALTNTLVTKAGGEEYMTTVPVLGKVGWFPNTGAATPVIASGDYILFHPFAKNTAAIPRVWAENPVAVKDVGAPTVSNALVIGSEISVANNTTEAVDPAPGGSPGAVFGLYISYINTANNGSAAIYTTRVPGAGANNNGWKHGIFLDGIAAGGTGISLRNAMSGNFAMAVGIDVSTHTGAFGTAGILVGNAHRISGKKVDGTVRELVYINASNVMVVGDANTQDMLMRLWGTGFELNATTAGGTGISLKRGASALAVGIDLSTHTGAFTTAGLQMGNAHRISGKKTDGTVRELIYVNGANVTVVGDANTQDMGMKFCASSFDFTGITTATTATAGARTLPANPSNFMPITIAGTAYKIPLYNA